MALYGRFSILDFLKSIELGKFSLASAENILQHLRKKVARKVDTLRHENPGAKESYLAVKEDIKRLGVTPDTTYLYVQGHHLFDKVVSPMMEKVCSALIHQRQTEIAHQSMHSTQRSNELSCYANSLSDVTTMLKKNYGYQTSTPFCRILKDIEEYLER